MPSASPGTSVKKPDPNIKSMYPVSVESGSILGLSSAGVREVETHGGWAIFFSNKGYFPHPLLWSGFMVGEGQGLFFVGISGPCTWLCVSLWLGYADSFGEECNISHIKMCVLSP